MGKGLKEKGDLPKFSKEGSVGRKKMGFQKNGMIRGLLKFRILS